MVLPVILCHDARVESDWPRHYFELDESVHNIELSLGRGDLITICCIRPHAWSCLVKFYDDAHCFGRNDVSLQHDMSKIHDFLVDLILINGRPHHIHLPADESTDQCPNQPLTELDISQKHGNTQLRIYRVVFIKWSLLDIIIYGFPDQSHYHYSQHA